MSAHTPGLLSQPGTAAAVYDFMVNTCRIDPSTASREARLIAAAPELLAACKLALEAIAWWEDNHGCCAGATDDKSSAIRAAIAKAEGRE